MVHTTIVTVILILLAPAACPASARNCMAEAWARLAPGGSLALVYRDGMVLPSGRMVLGIIGGAVIGGLVGNSTYPRTAGTFSTPGAGRRPWRPLRASRRAPPGAAAPRRAAATSS